MRDRLFVHVIWTTRDREPLIGRQAAHFIQDFLPAVGRQERAAVLGMGMVRDHVHLVLHLHQTTAIPRLLQRMKGGSSVLLNRHGIVDPPLKWARGYDLVSISPRALDRAITYVKDQAKRHPDRAIAGWSPPSL